MKITNTIKVMKQINPDKIILLKVGNFYYEYGKDAYIVSFIFGYKIKTIEQNIPFSGFPKTALNKVISKLEENSISYIIVDRSQNYDVMETMNFKSKNCYIDYYNKAHRYILKKNKINNVYKYLIKNVNQKGIDKKISKIEEILYEV